MDDNLLAAFATHHGILHASTIRAFVTEGRLRGLVRAGNLVRVTHGTYALQAPSTAQKLAALESVLHTPVAASMGTAASLFGFDVQSTRLLHVVEPDDRRIESRPGVVVHQRRGAPLTRVDGTLVTDPAWTAVEVGRTLPAARALATFDAALRSRTCTPADLSRAVRAQRGRRGIVETRRVAHLADARSGSPMESHVRLILHDGDVPAPTLQWPVAYDGGTFFLDFAWPERLFGIEYDGDEFHSAPADVRRDKLRLALLADQGWRILQIVADDVRRNPDLLCARVRRALSTSASTAIS